MIEVEYIIGLRCTPYKRYACGQGDTFFSTKRRRHIIIIHPIKDCQANEFDAAISVLNHEILHGILVVIAGRKASDGWDNIARMVEDHLGGCCPCE